MFFSTWWEERGGKGAEWKKIEGNKIEDRLPSMGIFRRKAMNRFHIIELMKLSQWDKDIGFLPSSLLNPYPEIP